jgi:hypothetical protein
MIESFSLLGRNVYPNPCEFNLHRVFNFLTQYLTRYCNSIKFFLFLELMDYPDSDEEGAAATDGATIEGSAILDDDEAEQIEDTGDGAMDQDQGDNTGERDRAGMSYRKGPSTGSSYTSCGGHPADGPDLPPIYRTVRKEKEKQMVTRHLYGGASTETVCTDSGVTVSKVETIGSFANTGDKRHNHTMHTTQYLISRMLGT